MILLPLSETGGNRCPSTYVRNLFSSDRISRYSRSITTRDAGREELFAAAERTPGQQMLPPPPRGIGRIGPSRDGVPSARAVAEERRLARGQISKPARRARNQRERVAEVSGLIEGFRACTVAVQYVQHAPPRRRVGEDPGDHRGDAAVVARQQQCQAVAVAEKR